MPTDRSSATVVNAVSMATLQVPWTAAGALAEEWTGMPAAELRFAGMAPVSTARQRGFGRTVDFICGQLVTSAITEIEPLLAQEQHLGTTPERYLRRIRLERAHQDLATADAVSGTTAAGVARRWGWASFSQFSLAYRRRFGKLPRLSWRK
jgi:hypothetical protein